MTIIYSDKGVSFDTKVILADTSNHFGHRMLATELLKQRNEMYTLLEELQEVTTGAYPEIIKNKLAKDAR